MRRTLLILLLITGSPAFAQVVVAARTLPAQHVIEVGDVVLSDEAKAGYAKTLSEVVGRETSTAIYANQPVSLGMLRPPALIRRNQTVQLSFHKGGLLIATEGRALAQGATGEVIRVMNLASRRTVFGTVKPDGTVEVN